MSMTSHAYSQEVTEESHTALVRSRLLQQMEASSTSDVRHLGSRRSPSSAQTALQPGFLVQRTVCKRPCRAQGATTTCPLQVSMTVMVTRLTAAL